MFVALRMPYSTVHIPIAKLGIHREGFKRVTPIVALPSYFLCVIYQINHTNGYCVPDSEEDGTRLLTRDNQSIVILPVVLAEISSISMYQFPFTASLDYKSSLGKGL